MKALATTVGAGMVALAGLLAAGAEQGKGDGKVETRVFEMRTYHAAPGKMEALHARFLDHTCRLIKKHGMTLIGFWTPADAKEAQQKLVYILAHPSKDAADKSWKSFREDPEWTAAKAASERDGKLVEKVDTVFMNPTDYSPIK